MSISGSRAVPVLSIRTRRALLDRVEDLPRCSRARFSAAHGLGVRNICALVREPLAESRASIAVAFGSPRAVAIARQFALYRRVHVPASRDSLRRVDLVDWLGLASGRHLWPACVSFVFAH